MARAAATPRRTTTAAGAAGRLDRQLVAIGVVGGLLSGLLGVGGGIVMVPLLVLWAGYGQRDAHALSLGAIIPISIAGSRPTGSPARCTRPEAVALAVGAIAGARLGAGCSRGSTSGCSKLVFGLFLLAVAVMMVHRS